MYEAVHAHPDGDSTLARHALTASEYGYDGVVLRNHGDQPADADTAEIRETYDIDVVEGVEVRAEDPSRASGFVGNHRDGRTIVLVHGGDTTINRFAVEQPAVDVLAHPMIGDGDFNHVLAKAAVENGVRVELSLARVLRADGGRRVQAQRDLRKLRELIEQYDVPFVVSADPRTHLHLRAPRDLRAVGETIGLDGEGIEAGLGEWRRLTERNRERMAPEYVSPGVRIESEGTETSTEEEPPDR